MGRKKSPKGSGGASSGNDAVPAEGSGIVWELNPDRAGATFYLSKQVSKELDRLRADLNYQDVHSSKSEIAEIALQMAIEEVRSRGPDSELMKRLSGNYRRL